MLRWHSAQQATLGLELLYPRVISSGVNFSVSKDENLSQREVLGMTPSAANKGEERHQNVNKQH